MASIGGSNIVREGLVLCLDAANQKSYVSGSTVWRDISSNNNNGSLVNGSTFNSASLGSISFDGINDYVSTSNNTNISSSSARTISCWINPNSTYTLGNFYSIAKIGTGAQAALFEMLIYFGSSTTAATIFGHFFGGGQAVGTTDTINTNEWSNILLSYNGITAFIYINGIQKASSGFSLNTTNSTLTLGAPEFGGHFYYKGLIANTLLYNRALSASEVLQNYEALKSRYIY